MERKQSEISRGVDGLVLRKLTSICCRLFVCLSVCPTGSFPGPFPDQRAPVNPDQLGTRIRVLGSRHVHHHLRWRQGVPVNHQVHTQILPAFIGENVPLVWQELIFRSSGHSALFGSETISGPKALAKRYSQLKPSYKIKTDIGGWPNGTTKSSQLARKPFSCLTTTAQCPHNNKTTWLELTIGGQTVDTSSQVVNLARLGLSWEYRLARV